MLSRLKSYFFGTKEELPPSTNSSNEENSSNRRQVMQSFLTTMVDSIKIAMATLLSIFVPQYCEESGGTCTLYENFTNLTTFNEFVIFMNFLSLAFFIKLTYVINKREAYFISHLNESRARAYNSFPENLAPYPRIVIRVKEHNKRLKIWTHWTLRIFALNVLFSAILIFNYFYDGFRSVSTMLANVLLVSSKLYALYTTAEDCNQYKPLALSSTQLTPVSYNVVDDDYAIKTEDGPKRYKIRISVDDGKRRGSVLSRSRSKSLPAKRI